MRRSDDRLIFTMRISIPGKTVFILRRGLGAYDTPSRQSTYLALAGLGTALRTEYWFPRHVPARTCTGCHPRPDYGTAPDQTGPCPGTGRLQKYNGGHSYMYHQISNISRTLEGNTLGDNSDVVGASPVGAAPTTSSFST